MKTKILILLLIVTIATGACKKEKLTKETQIGANTFSCKINGKVYKVKPDFLSETLTGGIYLRSTQKYELSLEGVMFNGEKSDYTISLGIPEFASAGFFDLRDNNICYIYTNVNGNQYTSKISKEGYINIKYIDYSNRICAGTFEFVGVNINNPNDKIYVTEGRFDVKNKRN